MAGVSREAHYDWLQMDHEYAICFSGAKELAGDALQDEARRRAIAGSDKLLMFLLRSLMPEKYGTSKVEHAAAGAAPTTVTIKFV